MTDSIGTLAHAATTNITAGAVINASATDNGNGGSKTELFFFVVGDKETLWKSKALRKNGEIDDCKLRISSVTNLELHVLCPGSAEWAWALWVDPCFYK